MELSIVVPVYNVEDYLENCIHFLHDQELENSLFEIILVNDGSTDQSLSVCKSLARQYPSVRVVDQPNKGLSAAHNRGIDSARGRYIYFIDSDDYIKSHFLQIALNEDLCFVGFSLFSTSNRFKSSSEVPELKLVMKDSGLVVYL